MIRRCAGSSAATRRTGAWPRRARWAALRRNGSRRLRTSLLLPTCLASGPCAWPKAAAWHCALKYAIRLPANQVLQSRIGYLLTRSVGRPAHHVRRSHASYQAGTWTKPGRVIAKVEWHPGELYPRVGFIVTNMSRPVERVVAFYSKRGTCDQWIKEGKGAIKWVVTNVRRQRGAAPASRARLQPRQFPAHAGDAGGSRTGR